MQKLKKPVSILLVFMMIVSLFAAVPMTVNAAPPGGGGLTGHTLTLYANNGTNESYSHTEILGNMMIGTPTSYGFTTPDNKEFSCWNTQANGGGTDYTAFSNYSYNEDLTLYAQWVSAAPQTFKVFVKTLTGATYTIENLTGATTVAQLKEIIANQIDIPATAQRLIFAGKQLEDAKTLAEYNIQKESTIHLVPRGYTVTWLNYDNSELGTTTVQYGSTPTYDGETPTKAAADGDHMYVFSGWTPELAPVTEDVTYTATFTSAVISERAADLVEITDHETELADLGLDDEMSEWGRSMTDQEAITLAQYMSAQNDGAQCAVLYEVVDNYELQYAMSDGTTGSHTDFYYSPLNDFLPDYKVYYLPVNLNPETIELNLNQDNATVNWDDSTGEYGYWAIDAIYDGKRLTLNGENQEQAAGTYEWADMKEAGTPGITDAETYERIVRFINGSCTVTVDEDVVTVSGTFTGVDRNTYVVTVTHEAPYYTITDESVNGAVTAGVNGADVTRAKAGKTVLLNVAPADGYLFKSITVSAPKDEVEYFSDLVALMGDSVFDGNEDYNCAGYTCKVENGKFVVYNGTTFVTELSESNMTEFDPDTDYVQAKSDTADWIFFIEDGKLNGISVLKGLNDYIYKSAYDSEATGSLPLAERTLTTVTEGSQYSFTMPNKPVTVTAEFEAIPTYTVTWKNDDGTTIDTTTVKSGVVPTHADPTKAEDENYTYTFAGWTPEITAVAGDITYTATFDATFKGILSGDLRKGLVIDAGTPIRFAMSKTADSWALFGLQVYLDDVLVKSVQTEQFQPTEPDRYYTTTRKCIVDSYSGSGSYPRANHTLRLKSLYTVTWKNGDDVLETDVDVVAGKTPSYDGETPTKDGVTFAGWTDSHGVFYAKDAALPEVTADETYTAVFELTIGSVDEWNSFAASVKGGNTYSGITVRMTADVGPVTTMVDGTFSGTFDGDGHTLTVNISGGSTPSATFAYVKDATIQNLRLEGTVTSSGIHTAALVRSISDNGSTCTIKNVDIYADVNCSQGYIGGFIGHAGVANTVNIENSIFAGSINKTGSTQGFIGAFIGWSQKLTATINNCAFTGSYNNINSFNNIGFSYNAPTKVTVSGFYSNASEVFVANVNHGTRLYVPSSSYPTTVALVKNNDGETFYSAFSDALAAWTDGSTLALLADVTCDSLITVPAADTKTLDLNGNALSLSYSSTKVEVNGTLTIQSTASGGSITPTSKSRVINVVDGGTLNIESGTINGYNADRAVIGGVGTINFNGGKIVTPASNAFSPDGVATLNLNGGEIECTSGSTSMGTASAVWAHGDSTINWNGTTITTNTGDGIRMKSAGNGTVNVTGGSFTATSSSLPEEGGYAIYCNSNMGTLNLEGNPSISGRGIYLADDKVINITNDLSNTNPISITMQTPGVFTSGLSGNGDASNFANGNGTGYAITLNASGEAQIVSTYTITWNNWDDTELEKDENVAAGSTPSYDGTTPEKAEDEQYTYTFSGWKAGETTYSLNEALPPVTGDVTYTAQFDAVAKNYFPYASLSLAGDIGVNFAIDTYGYDPEELRVNVSWYKYSNDYYFTGENALSIREIGDKTYFIATANVAAKEMADTITVTLYKGDTELAAKTYSVRDYALTIINAENPGAIGLALSEDEFAALKDLCKALLKYGSAAEAQFDPQYTDHVAAHTVDDEVISASDGVNYEGYTAADIPSYTVPDYSDTFGTYGLEYYGSSIGTKTTTNYLIVFVGSNAPSVLYNGETIEPVEFGEGGVAYNIDGIAAKDILNDIVLTVNGNDVHFNMLAYMNKALIVGDETLQNSVRALYDYGAKAKAYFDMVS